MTDKDIVKALRRYTTLTNGCRCDDCPAEPLKTGKRGCGYVSLEAADAIERLTADVERLTRERDAAVRDMRGNACLACAHYEQKDGQHECFRCENRSKFSWRGVCAENGGKDG